MADAKDILDYIKNELLEDESFEIDEDSSLFQDRILDSLNLLSLISFLEDKYSIKVETSEVNIDNLDSVTKITAFLQTKTEGQCV